MELVVIIRVSSDLLIRSSANEITSHCVLGLFSVYFIFYNTIVHQINVLLIDKRQKVSQVHVQKVASVSLHQQISREKTKKIDWKILVCYC